MKKKDLKLSFRYLPVPGTGKSKWNARGWVIPRTTQELRHCYPEPDIFPSQIFYRRKRGKHKLWFAWDDKYRSDLSIKNWKKYRKHQWKEKSA